MFKIIEGNVFLVDEDGNSAKLDSAGNLQITNNIILYFLEQISKELTIIRLHLESMTDEKFSCEDSEINE